MFLCTRWLVVMYSICGMSSFPRQRLLKVKSQNFHNPDPTIESSQNAQKKSYDFEKEYSRSRPSAGTVSTRKDGSSDPWKVLMTKFDSSQGLKIKVGKVGDKKNGISVDELKCPHFGSCSGCTVQGNFSLTPIVSRAKSFFTSEGIRPIIHVGNFSKWRTHVKLAVQAMSRWGGLKIGLYQANSHIVEAIPDCQVHHPSINIAVEELRLAAIDAGVTGYQRAQNGQPSQGDLRYIQLSLERESGKIQLALVWNSPTYKDAGQSLMRFVKRLKSRYDIWHSIYVNFQTSSGDFIFNPQPKAWKLLWGPPILREKVGSAYFYFQPQIFRQSNLEMFESGILPAVMRCIPEQSRVAELYAGIGVLGLNIATKAQEVLCSDSNEYVDGVFDKCADSLPEEHQEKVFYEPMSADEAVEEGQCEQAEVLVVDPPRKGLDEGVLQLLVGTHESASAPDLHRLIYVSCGYDALEKDYRTLIDSGLWTLKSVDLFVLFPGSDHVETVAVFDRKPGIQRVSSATASTTSTGTKTLSAGTDVNLATTSAAAPDAATSAAYVTGNVRIVTNSDSDFDPSKSVRSRGTDNFPSKSRTSSPSKSTRDRPYGDSQSNRDRPYGDSQSNGDRPYGDSQSNRDRPYGDSQSNRHRPYGDSQSTRDRPYGDSQSNRHRPYGDSQSNGDRPYGDSQSNRDRPYGDPISDRPPRSNTNQNEGRNRAQNRNYIERVQERATLKPTAAGQTSAEPPSGNRPSVPVKKAGVGSHRLTSTGPGIGALVTGITTAGSSRAAVDVSTLPLVKSTTRSRDVVGGTEASDMPGAVGTGAAGGGTQRKRSVGERLPLILKRRKAA